MAMFLFTLALAASLELNPITRVAELLEELSAKVDADAKKEQDLYDGFKCWCMKVINGKSESIEKNEQRIGELNAYIDDLSSGRVELTSERGTLEDEIASLEKAIAEETAMRTKEKKDFDAAKDELDKAIAALEDAVAVMANGTSSSNRSSLVALKARLTTAAKVGAGFLAKRDVDELFKALAEDTPDVDYNKLNQDAGFKMKYEHRSGEIQDILAEMLNTFKDNRDEAVNAEEKAKTDSANLLGAKNEQLTDAKQAGLDQSVELGARAASKAESQSEADNLTGQNERDKGFIADAKQTCADKASDWEERKRVRSGEKAAIQQTIATLRSDDARDLFKKSFGSQGKTFIQMSAVVQRVMRPQVKQGIAMLENAAIKSGDVRVLTLAKKIRDAPVSEGNPFEEVAEAVEGTIEDLKKEEAADLKEKEECDVERHEKTQEVQMKSKAIDSNTARIARFNSYIQEAQTRVDEITVEIKDLENQKEDAKVQRDKEHAEFEIALEDDTKAVEVVGNAIKVLEDFYAKENLSMGRFLQVSASLKASTVAASTERAPGEAPTPPPTTFDGPYKGAAGETGGVVGLMEMIKTDIGKDIQKADKAESDAVTAYNKLVADIDADILSLQTTKGGLEDAIADDTTSREEQKENRGTNQESMGATLDALKAIAKSCDWIIANLEPRMHARQQEMDNLNKAKAVFSGATFSEPAAEE
jgi:hypothetical protein